MCGEQSSLISPVSMVQGSPPRVRGTASAIGLGTIGERITPACAGNSTAYATAGNTGWDHPRVCGEQAGILVDPTTSGGSPPRVRGTANAIHYFIILIRITPACAGNSLADRQRIEQV